MTNEITQILDGLEKLAEGTTPGPWSSGPYIAPGSGKFAVDTEMESDPHNITYDVHRAEDATFMAASRTALPAVVSVAKKDRELIAEIRRQIAPLADQIICPRDNVFQLIVDAIDENESRIEAILKETK